MTFAADEIDQTKVQSRGAGNYCYRWLPARLVFIALGFVAFNLCYAYKIMLSVAIVAMVRSDGNGTESDGGATGEFDWSHSAQAQLLSSFFYGYVITQLPAGVLTEMFGGKWLFGGSMLLCALMSLLGPLLARWSFYAFLVSRVVQGLAEGISYPCMNAMLAKWVPKMERTRTSTVIFTGSPIGAVITLAVTGVSCDSDFLGGWPAMFYILGVIGCVWFGLWAFLMHETPERHPHISQRELDYILSGQGLEKPVANPPIPWKKICTSIPFIALLVTHLGQNWGYLIILQLLPTYFEEALDLDIKNNGLYSSLPWLLQAIFAWIAGIIGDKLRQSGRLPINVIRKSANSIGYFIPAVLLILVPFAGQTASIALFMTTMAFNGFVYSGFLCTHVDMAPDFAGTLMGITNSLANFSGFIAPLVANAIVGENVCGSVMPYNVRTREGWAPVFYSAGGVFICTGLIFIFFGTANLQKWGKIDLERNRELNNAQIDNNNKETNDSGQPGGGLVNRAFEY